MYKDPILECTYLGAHSGSPNQSTGFMLATGLCLTSHPYCWVASFSGCHESLGMRLIAEQQTVKSDETTPHTRTVSPQHLLLAVLILETNGKICHVPWHTLYVVVRWTDAMIYKISGMCVGVSETVAEFSIGQTRWVRSIGWIGFHRFINSCK